MKNIHSFISIFVLNFILMSCNNDKEFSGYMAVDEKPVIEWVPSTIIGDSYDSKCYVTIITETGDSLKVYFNVENYLIGSIFLEYRDTHPFAVGQRLFIRGHYRDGIPLIEQVTPENRIKN